MTEEEAKQKSIANAVRQLQEIRVACKELIKTLDIGSENEVKFAVMLTGLLHNMLFNELPKKAIAELVI